MKLKHIKGFNEMNSVAESVEINADIEPTSSSSNIIIINKEEQLMDYNNEPYAYEGVDENLEYIGTYIKGKARKKLNIDNTRILVKGVDTGKMYMMFVAKDFVPRESHFIEFISTDYITEFDGMNHLKFRAYNYYLMDNDPSIIDTVLSYWKNNNPKTDKYDNDLIADNERYNYIFEFNGNTY